ncbi:MAG: DUF1684 domain-containing protein [Opitutus sp.]|nr:DUF1684 domain-containing protein [Opitutus sp.]
MMHARIFFLLSLGLALGAAGATVDDYAKSIEAWRADRLARLTAPTGWLTLIGLHFLQPGDNTVGSRPDNGIVLAKGPAHFGTVMLGEDGRVTAALAATADARVDGRTVLVAELHSGAGNRATLVSAGSVSFFVIERGGKKALRVKDSAAVRRTRFPGLDYFPVDPSWRIEAQWVPFEEPRQIMITNSLGQLMPALVPGKVVFEREGKLFELLSIDEGPGEPLFFVLSDLTSGKETYAAARFLYADAPVDGKVVLDFNRTENPPCAFTPFATCPLPPKENQLPFAVSAGEKNFRGSHD